VVSHRGGWRSRTLGGLAARRAARSIGPTIPREGRTDYRLLRRAVLAEVRAGRRARADVCDAHPDLLRAGRHLGTEVPSPCPLCDAPDLRHVDYVFERRSAADTSGRAVPRALLARHAQRRGDLRVFTVEVCVACHWHHVVESFELRARKSAVV